METVVSLLEASEAKDLNLAMEGAEAAGQGMRFVSLPLVDRDVPGSKTDFLPAIEELDRALRSGSNVVVHCRQGVGRTGLVAACLLMLGGAEAKEAVRTLSEARGIEMPETLEQRRWIDRFAESLASVAESLASVAESLASVAEVWPARDERSACPEAAP